MRRKFLSRFARFSCTAFIADSAVGGCFRNRRKPSANWLYIFALDNSLCTNPLRHSLTSLCFCVSAFLRFCVSAFISASLRSFLRLCGSILKLSRQRQILPSTLQSP